MTVFLYVVLIIWASAMVFIITTVIIQPFWEKRRINRGLSMTQYQIVVPRNLPSPEANVKDLISIMEQVYAGFSYLKLESWLNKIRYGNPYISLEIVSPTERDEINFYIGVPKGYESIFEKQIHGVYPEAELKRIQDYNVLVPGAEIRAGYLKLKKPYILPIRTYKELESNPLNVITSALSKIQEDESAVVQILIQRVSDNWSDNGKKVVKKMQKGESFKDSYNDVFGGIDKQFIKTLGEATKYKNTQDNEPKVLLPQESLMMEKISQKTAKVAYATNIRLLTISRDKQRADVLFDQLEGAFAQFANGDLNEFKVVKYPLSSIKQFIYTFIFRLFSERESMLLNSEELTSIYHIPSVGVETPKVTWITSKTSHPPVDLPKEGLLIGKNVYRGEESEVRIKAEDRRRHMYLIGQTGTGKSSLMKKMIQEDLQAGHGLALLDPNGDFAVEVLGMIPPHRMDDVIYFNPADTNYPMGLNILEARTHEEKDFLIQEMISIFYKLVSDPSMIGPIFEHNMRMAMAALMSDVNNPRTLVEIPLMFTDEAFRREVLLTVDDPVIRHFWEKEFPATQKGSQAGDTLGYLLSKLGRFIENEMVRNIIGQPRSSFDFQDIMNSGKILIGNLSKGGLGEQNSNLLGMLLVSKLQMAAFKRNEIPEEQRRDFYLYLDEFQNFTTDSISTILSEARKYRLCLILAHQYIGQLSDGIRNAVFGNVGTVVSFRISSDDAEVIAQRMQPYYTAEDLVLVDNLKSVITLMINGKTSKAFNMEVIFADRTDAYLQQRVITQSRQRYSKPVAEVRADIENRTHSMLE
ncbi:MAG: hypothetical protein RLZZ223_289 [Candidatus Parcubacteria bacterium]